MNTAAMFFKECKKTIKSIPYMAYVAILLIFILTQLMPEFKKIDEPQPEQRSYGVKYTEDPEIIMPAAINNLYQEFISNSYTAYPLGFYKNIKLNNKKQEEMAGILAEVTGVSKDELLQSAITEQFTHVVQIDINAAINYEEFLYLMKKADRIIGGGSMYSELYLYQFGKIDKTYEDALTEYIDIIQKDRVSGAYARLFSDYAGIILAVCPVFVAVTLGLKDKMSRMNDLIYTRQASSIKIVFVRYFAMISMMLLPVLLIAFWLTMEVVKFYSEESMINIYANIDMLAFVKYTFGWLLPTLMVSTAVGVFLTGLTGTPIAILVQGLWWFFGLFSGIRIMEGGYGWSLAPRHNILGNTRVYLENFKLLMVNRIIYAVMAIVLVSVSALVYEAKRKGRFYTYDSNRKSILISIRKVFVNYEKISKA